MSVSDLRKAFFPVYLKFERAAKGFYSCIDKAIDNDLDKLLRFFADVNRLPLVPVSNESSVEASDEDMNMEIKMKQVMKRRIQRLCPSSERNIPI
jgi:hypothetical protein